MKYETNREYIFPERGNLFGRKWKIDRATDVCICLEHSSGVWISADMIIAIANQLLDVKEYNPEDYENE